MLITDRFKVISELNPHMKALFYGRSGTGKTTLASTFPGKILMLDIRENGTESMSDVEGAIRLDVKSVADMTEIYNELETNNKKLKFKTVVIDSVTMLEKLVLEEVQAKTKGTFGFKQWGEVSATLNELVILFRDLPMNVVFLAQDKTKKDSDSTAEDDLDPEVGPSVMPSVAKLLNGAVSVIGQTFIREKEVVKNGVTSTKMQYRLRLGPSPYYITKIRKPKSLIVPESIINPTYEQILTIQKGTYASN